MVRYSLLGGFIILLTLFHYIVCPSPLGDHKLEAHYSLSFVRGTAKYHAITVNDDGFIFNHRGTSTAFSVKFSDILFDAIETIDPQTVKFPLIGKMNKFYTLEFEQAAQVKQFIKNRVSARDTKFVLGTEIATSYFSPVLFCFKGENGDVKFHLLDCNASCPLNFTFNRSEVRLLGVDGLIVQIEEPSLSNEFHLYFKIEDAKNDFLTFFE